MESASAWPLALAEAEAELRLERARARAREGARTEKEVLVSPAWVRADALAIALGATSLESLGKPRSTNEITYSEVLADLNLKDIIYSIKPDYRQALTRYLWQHPHHWWLTQIFVPITRLPQELLHQILFFVIDNASNSPVALMLVCELWHTTVTGIWASLNLGARTPKYAVTSKLERKQWFLDVSVDMRIEHGYSIPSEDPYGAIFAAIEAISRWRSFVVKSLPAQADLPEYLVNHGLKRCSNTAMSRLRIFEIKCACEMSPLLDRLLRILDTSASGELTTVEINSASVVSFLVLTCSSIFRSVTVLSLDTLGLRNPVELLPHLHQLETLTAAHLPLPVYDNSINLRFVHSLRHLKLRSASIQWMSGRTFRTLESCTLLVPLHRHVLHTFRTTLPNCKHLTFEGYPLNILGGVSAHKITHLSVTCSSSSKPRGTQQLVWFSSQALRESRLVPRILHISIEAKNQAWTKALAFMSNLEELVIENVKPSSLGVKVLRLLVVHPVRSNRLGTTGTPDGRNTPVYPSLKRFGLKYRRWLRPSEHLELISELKSIISSRQQSKCSLQSFRIWTGSDQKNPLELIKEPWTSLEGFERLMLWL
jgi:hypothetical protein